MARTTIPHVITEDSALGGNFDIERSCTFIRPDNNYYHRTPSSTSNQKTWTYSCWYKRGLLSYSLGNVFEQYSKTSVIRFIDCLGGYIYVPRAIYSFRISF